MYTPREQSTQFPGAPLRDKRNDECSKTGSRNRGRQRCMVQVYKKKEDGKSEESGQEHEWQKVKLTHK